MMNRDALELLKSRRSIRAFQAGQVEKAALDAVVEIGMYAPTAMGLQSPLIVVVQDETVRATLTKMNAEIMGKDVDPYYGAPTILLVFGDTDRPTWIEDGTSVLTAMQYAAPLAGLGACWINRERQMFDSDEGRALMQAWGVDPRFRGVGALALGYPDCVQPEPAPRKDGYVRFL